MNEDEIYVDKCGEGTTYTLSSPDEWVMWIVAQCDGLGARNVRKLLEHPVAS
jgi:hypothetical protein